MWQNWSDITSPPLRMNLACQKWLGNFTKVLGIGRTPLCCLVLCTCCGAKILPNNFVRWPQITNMMKVAPLEKLPHLLSKSWCDDIVWLIDQAETNILIWEKSICIIFLEKIFAYFFSKTNICIFPFCRWSVVLIGFWNLHEKQLHIQFKSQLDKILRGINKIFRECKTYHHDFTPVLLSNDVGHGNWLILNYTQSNLEPN